MKKWICLMLILVGVISNSYSQIEKRTLLLGGYANINI